MPSDTDNDLLARLNALKKSSVSLDSTTPHASIGPSQSSVPSDDLAARFARLGSASPSPSPQPSRTSTTIASAPAIAPGATSYLEGIAQGIGGGNVEFNEEDERSLEELLSELNSAVGDSKEWDLNKSEKEDVGKLLKDMRTILPQIVNDRSQQVKSNVTETEPAKKEQLTDWESIEVNVGAGSVNLRQEEPEDDVDDEGVKKRSEEEEADDVIARVMAELDISKKYDPPSPPPEVDDSESGGEKGDPKSTNSGDTSEGFSLPSAPTELPEDDFARTQAIEDAFTARLAALSAPSPKTDALGLPSAPSFSPQKKPAVSSNLQKRIDDEIETWCVICQDDATLKCLGCDDDLYCQNCWMEGHKGESAGLEERRHKAVLYSKKKKQPA
ncbi:hypothetical protein IQ07DRAFT_187538 [Pyrenochaeta sp. DS3sAY3a]|nr:hypothetical protein IQ07DRAFT_187538 [Pyrenochaeta sp. DS3sAY3a]